MVWPGFKMSPLNPVPCIPHPQHPNHPPSHIPHWPPIGMETVGNESCWLLDSNCLLLCLQCMLFQAMQCVLQEGHDKNYVAIQPLVMVHSLVTKDLKMLHVSQIMCH